MTLADRAAAAFGGRVVRLIKARENEVYEIAVPQGRAALRLHRQGYQSATAIRSELWWCGALAERGLSVPRPLPTDGGQTVVTFDGTRHASAVSWIDGAPLGEAGVPLGGTPAEREALHEDLGAFLARLHAETEALDLPDGFERPRWDLDGLLGQHPFWGRFWEHPALTPDEARCLSRARDLLRARIGAHAGHQPLRLIHADVLRENVFVDGPSLSLIDFDDAGFGYPAYDLGTVLSQSLTEPALPRIANALIVGYARGLPLDPEIVPVFTLMRCCASVGWMIPRLEPGHPTIRSHIDRAVRLATTMLDGHAPW